MTAPVIEHQVSLGKDFRVGIRNDHGTPDHWKTWQVIDIISQIDHMSRVKLSLIQQGV